MKKTIYSLLIIFVLTSCNNLEKTNTENNSELENILPQKELTDLEPKDTELIAQKILDLPRLQWIYHSEINERLPVKVLESELIKKNITLTKFGRKVRILSISEIEKEGINDYVVFDRIEIKEDTTEFEISYRIEGAVCSGKFIKQDKEWRILDYSVYEY
jgi:hypothetical protein